MSRPTGTLRRRGEIAAGLGVLALVAAVVQGVDPEQSGSYPRCPFAVLTGLACPGCGSLRALHDLVHGSPLQALDHNALFVAVLGAAVLLAMQGLLRPSTRAVRPWLAYTVPAVLVLWTVLRNLPWAPFVVLAP